MEEIIIHTVGISRAGEIKHFEIPLSNNAEFITGLWYKIRLITDATKGAVITSLFSRSPYQPELVIGQLSLSSNQREGVFFFGNLILENRNLGLLDFTSGVFPVKDFSHAAFQKHLEVRVDSGTASVHGFIEDKWGVLNGSDVRYEVDIYLIQKLKS